MIPLGSNVEAIQSVYSSNQILLVLSSWKRLSTRGSGYWGFSGSELGDADIQKWNQPGLTVLMIPPLIPRK